MTRKKSVKRKKVGGRRVPVLPSSVSSIKPHNSESLVKAHRRKLPSEIQDSLWKWKFTYADGKPKPGFVSRFWKEMTQDMKYLGTSKKGRGLFPSSQCFGNAYRAALRDPTLDVYLGYAIMGGGHHFVDHVFNVRNGQVIEMTKTFPPNAHYVGNKLTMEDARQLAINHGIFNEQGRLLVDAKGREYAEGVPGWMGD